MLRPRILPCLLVRNGGLVKTVKFRSEKYVGDPINAVKIFNEKGSDELIVLDIDATVNGREPDWSLIAQLAAECRMPLCYGGGVKTLEHARRTISLGVEKVALSSAAIEDPPLIGKIATELGSQSVVVVLDVKREGVAGNYVLMTHNGRCRTGLSPFDFAASAQRFGAGEIVVNSVDNDGEMSGYDMLLAARMRDAISVPMTVLGGAGSLRDIGDLIASFGIVGAAAGSLFVFKGKYRAVLINYPSFEEKDRLISEFFPAAHRGTTNPNTLHATPNSGLK